MQFTLFVVDDDPFILKTIRQIFKTSDYELQLFDSGYGALDALEHTIPDLVLLDINMRGLDGIQVLKRVKERNPDILVIIITGFATIESAIEAMRAGAYDYIQKPFTPEQMRRLVANALATLTLKKEVDELRNSLLQKNHFRRVVGKSASMQHVIRLVDQYAPSNVTVLIEGEHGTEKETVAEYIHYLSERFARPYVTLHCGAIREEMIEQELFGQVDNFPYGVNKITGVLDRAQGGTLYLDEISALPHEIQLKLVDALEMRMYYPIGSVAPNSIDVRLIAATNVPLDMELERGRIREELYYHLNVAKIVLPPLRDRKSDIVPMANYYIEYFNAQLGKSVKPITEDAGAILLSHPFRGNVWELRNIIERVMLLTTGDVITRQDLIDEGVGTPLSTFHVKVKLNDKEHQNVIHHAVKDIVEKTLKICGQNKSLAAKRLGIPRSTLRHYLKRDE